MSDIGRKIKTDFLVWLLGGKQERKIGEFWLIKQTFGSNTHVEVETETIRSHRLEREKLFKKEKLSPKFFTKKKRQ